MKSAPGPRRVTTTHRAPNQLRRRSFRESRSRGSRAAVSSDWCTGDFAAKKKKPTRRRARSSPIVRRSQSVPQHNTAPTATQHNRIHHKRKNRFSPAFSLSGYWSRPERKASFTRRRPRRRVRRGQTSRRVASVFPTATRANPAGIDACRYLRVDLGPTRTVARRSASASPPRRPRAAGPRARRERPRGTGPHRAALPRDEVRVRERGAR